MTREEMVKKMAALGNQDVSAEFLTEYDAKEASIKALEAEKKKLEEERAALRDTNQKLFLRVSQVSGREAADSIEITRKGTGETLSERIAKAKGLA